jgi:hypothetical protein
MAIDYCPRLSVDISDEHKRLLDKYFGDYGRKKEMVQVILDGIFDMIEKHGAPTVIGALVNRVITINEVCKLGVTSGNNRKT